MAQAIKRTTNLTGLPVVENAKKRLSVLYNKILKELTKMPTSYPYRKNTEDIVKHRLAIVDSDVDIETVEKKIACGQVEELLIQATRELDLARKFLVWKPWEPLRTPAPVNQWKWPM